MYIYEPIHVYIIICSSVLLYPCGRSFPRESELPCGSEGDQGIPKSRLITGTLLRLNCVMVRAGGFQNLAVRDFRLLLIRV